MKKLYRSKDDKFIFGVLGGIAEYFETDPVIVRVGFVVLSVICHIFPMIVAYIILAIIMPAHPKVPQIEVTPMPMKTEENKSDENTKEEVK